MFSTVRILSLSVLVLSVISLGLLINVQVLELEKCGVQLEQCQLVMYNEKSGTLGEVFDDEPKVRE